MLTCDPILFKCSNNWYQSWHGRHLSCIFGLFWFSRFFFFLVTEAIFFSLRLVFILGFQARLRLDTGRECCLEQNPSFFVVFGAHLGISKIRACLVLAIMRFFFFFPFFFLWILGFVLKEI